MDISAYRRLLNRGLKIALPLLVFQIAFLVMLPDSFGLNEDFGVLTKSTRANCFCLGINHDPRISTPTGLPKLKFHCGKQDSQQIYAPCTEKWGCCIQKAPPAEDCDGPLPICAPTDCASQESTQDSSPLFDRILHSIRERPDKRISPNQKKNHAVSNWFVCLSGESPLSLQIPPNSKATSYQIIERDYGCVSAKFRRHDFQKDLSTDIRGK
jgi:hypothetical protein